MSQLHEPGPRSTSVPWGVGAEGPEFQDVSSRAPLGRPLPPPCSFPSTANEGRNDYHPMFFTHDRAFEELFGICIQLLNKTWKEMRATAEDFNKVSVTELCGPRAATLT